MSFESDLQRRVRCPLCFGRSPRSPLPAIALLVGATMARFFRIGDQRTIPHNPVTVF